ncbi:SDR family oxidoreductase [Hydrogenophaga pseudoflava]|nr:SDR family oxidoreductase [Hydrogenophaga pseudoflava]
MSLQGRTALVTGAVTGIGRACALRLAQAGAFVWVNHLGQADAADAVDVLVNNAGIIQEKPFLETTEADWDRMLAVDLKAVFLVCRAVIPGMLARGGGAIVNIASDLGILGRARPGGHRHGLARTHERRVGGERAGIPQHRLGAPEEIADSVLFLASDLSRFYTGQVLGPNGGSATP